MKAAASSRSPFPVNKAALIGAGLVSVLTLIVLLPATPILYHIPITDSSIFMFIGNKIRLGQFPYADWYDHKPPLIFYINALGFWLGGSRWGVWAIELLSLGSAGLLGFAFLRRYFGSFIAALAMSAALLNLNFVFDRGNLTEEYALPFQFLTLFLLSDIARGKRPVWRLFLVGCALAMASSLKQPLAGFGITVIAYLAVFHLRLWQWRKLLRAVIWVALGFAAVWAAWFAYFALAGIFPEFWEAAFTYNFALSGIPLEKRIQALVSGLDMLFQWSGFFLGGVLAWLAVIPYLLAKEPRFLQIFLKRVTAVLLAVCGLAGVVVSLVRLPVLLVPGLVALLVAAAVLSGWLPRRLAHWMETHPVSQEVFPDLLPWIIILVDLPVAVVLTSLSGNNFAHYFMTLFPSLTLSMAFLVRSVIELTGRSSGKAMGYIWLVILMLPVFGPGVLDTIDHIGPRGDRQVETTVEYVKTHTQPNDKILEWGIATQVYVLSGRDAPSRYFFPDPLFVANYSGQSQTGELLRDLKASPPVLIVYERNASLPMLTAQNPGECAQVKDPQIYARFVEEWQDKTIYQMLPRLPQGMDEVYFWICQNYQSVGPIGELGWDVYRWKGK